MPNFNEQIDECVTSLKMDHFDEQIDQCIVSLKIIGMIQENSKLCIKDGMLSIELNNKFTILNKLCNKNNNNKRQYIDHVRKSILNAILISKNIINKKTEFEMLEWTLKRMLKEFSTCQNGLINLKTIYSNDTLIIAHIDTLIDRLSLSCEELHNYLKI